MSLLFRSTVKVIDDYVYLLGTRASLCPLRGNHGLRPIIDPVPSYVTTDRLHLE